MTGRHTVPTAQTPPVQSQGEAPLTVDQPHKAPLSAAHHRSSKREIDRIALLNGLAIGLLATMIGGHLLFQLTHQPKYEYQTVSPNDYAFDREMNALGAAGWKTESCRRATSGEGYAATASYECIMSRPKLGW